MGKKKKTGKERLDKYYHMAKDQGYRSRAAFKLLQLNKKFNFLGKANTVIDLCAAPGSWSQIASKLMPVSKLIIAVDLDPIKAIPGVIALQQDITTPKCRSEISHHLKNNKADVVLHDGAPNVGTAWIQDAFSQAELTLSALKLATEFLVPGGTFVTKVFRSGEYNILLWVFHQLFKRVTATKPTASRNASAEIFVVCESYLAPKKIDPKLLDPRSVFKEMDLPKTINLLSKKKPKPNQEGYETGSILLFKKSSVLNFIYTDNPMIVLAENSELVFESQKNSEDPEFEKEELQLILNHPKTTPEIQECLKDLKVLSSKDFKLLLKWRLAMRDFAEIDKAEEEEKPEIELTEEQKTDLYQQEIEDTLAKAEKKKRRALKERQRKILKFQARQSLTASFENDIIDQEGVFNLRSIRKRTNLEALVGSSVDNIPIDENQNLMDRELEIVVEEEKESNNNKKKRLMHVFEDEQDNEKRVEKYLDLMYEKYLVANEEYRKKFRREKRIRERKNLAIPEDLTDFSKFEKLRELEEELEMFDDKPDNPLLMADPKEKISTKAALWFDSDIFDNVEDEDYDEEAINTLMKERQESMKKRKREALLGVSANSIQLEEDPSLPPSKRPNIGPNYTKGSKDTQENGIKKDPVLPNEKVTDSEENSFEEVEYEENALAEEFDACDPHVRAEILALGSLLHNPKERSKVIEKSFNKYMFNDDQNLPDWFKDDEEKHNRPEVPVSNELIQDFKNKTKTIDSRTSKKVAEAKARKMKRYHERLERARAKAKDVVASSELSEKEKMRQIKRLYRSNLKEVKPQKIYVVKRRAVGSVPKGKGNVRYKMVDPRLKKDKRAKKAQERKKR